MVSAISHNYAGRMLKDEMISGGSEVILRIGEMLDSRVFARAEAMWLECAARDAEISHAIDHPNDVSLYDYYKLCQKLYYLASENNDIVSSVDVYIGGSEVLISSKSGGRIKFIAEEPEALPEYFRSIVESGKASGGWIPSLPDAEIETTGFAGNNIITLYRTMPYIEDSGIKFKGYIAVHVKADAVASILESETAEKTYFTIVDNKGTPILSVGNVMPDEKTISEILSSGNKSYYNNRGGYIINAAVIPSGGLYVVRMMSDSVFFNRLRELHIALWIICGLFALLGMFISIFQAKQIYNPIRRIVNNIRKFTELEDDNRINEYSIIDSTISSLSSKVINLESEILSSREAMQVKQVISLLKGEIEDESGIDFAYDKFAAAVITVLPHAIDYESARCDTIAMLKSCQTVDFYYAVTFENRIGIIANYGKDINMSAVTGYLRSISEKLDDKLKMVISVGYETDKNNIHKSYADAVKTLQYSFFTDDAVLESKDYLWRELAAAEFDDSLIKSFVSALKRNDESKIMKSVDKLTDEIAQSGCSYKQCRNRIYAIFSVYFSFILEENKNPDYAITESTYSELNQCSGIDEFSEWFKNEIGEYLLCSKKEVNITANDMIEMAKQIIEDNLDRELSLNFVAQRLYIAPVYLSRVFKTETGENFNAYITDRRLELARKLIIETNDSVNVITAKTGFNSATYLIKKFKEKYGQTPVNYKKSYIISNSVKKEEKDEQI
ncbi:MAG: AraC family transcriptional regulator [Clostridia bacterium]|nr:AraC family transcriptional regulator [Clostridia bacterium]